MGFGVDVTHRTLGGHMVMENAQSNEVPVFVAREEFSLRILLDEINILTERWLKMIVVIAKSIGMTYYHLRKILARVLQKKQLTMSGYRKLLRSIWFSSDQGKLSPYNKLPPLRAAFFFDADWIDYYKIVIILLTNIEKV